VGAALAAGDTEIEDDTEIPAKTIPAAVAAAIRLIMVEPFRSLKGHRPAPGRCHGPIIPLFYDQRIPVR